MVASLVPPEAELESIAVSAAYQRRGVARRLFWRLWQANSASAECARSCLRCGPQISGVSFYRSLGFVEEGRRYGYYADPVEDAILMRLKLVASRPEQGQIGV